MKILTTAKRVIDPYSKVHLFSDGSGIDTTGIKFDLNPFDEIAIEEAVRIKERLPETEIVVVSIGKTECEDQLRKALAMGADRAILIECVVVLDSLGIAKILSDLAHEIKPDLILMGKQATDDDCNQVAQMLAAILNWPQATFASKIEFENQFVHVTRETDQGEEVLKLPLPCVVTADLRLNEPRYIALPGIIKARNKPLEYRHLELASSPKTSVVKMETPPSREGRKKVANVSELVSALKEKGVI